MWQIQIHHLVLEEDFKKFSPAQQNLILKTIQKKLTVNPEAYGKPLQKEFAGYWRLRIEDCRVIYRIVKDQVLILVVKVGIRKDDRVYKELFSRLKKI